MAKPIDDVADEIAQRFSTLKSPVATIRWDDLYDLNEVSTLKTARTQQLIQAIWDRHSLLMTHGDNVVVIARDRHFKPLP